MNKTTLNYLFHCAYSLNYHLVLVTKYRRKVLTASMIDRFAELAAERCEFWEGKLYECNGEPDHIHLLLSLPPKYALSDFGNALKTGTSRRLRKEFHDQLSQYYSTPTLWSRSYCVISAGGAPLDVLARYIQQQEKPPS